MGTKRSYVFGDNSLVVAKRIKLVLDTASVVVCHKLIVVDSNDKMDINQRMNDVVAVYDAVRRASVVDPLIAQTPTSI